MEPAPRTSLRADASQGKLEGFWSAQDGTYYARATGRDGAEQWYRIIDPTAARAYTARWARLGSRSILIGTSRRRGARSAR